MKRIFPHRNVLFGLFLGIMSGSALYFALFDKNGIDAKPLLFAVFLFSLAFHFVTMHTSYDSEFVVSWTFFKREKIRIEDILQIQREWISGGKGGGSYRWTISHWDRENKRERVTFLPLPANYKSKKVADFIDFIKSFNYKIEFVLDLR